MKKIKNILLVITVVLGIPIVVNAKSYTSLNLDETLTREKIEHDLSNYKETEEQITIYMFRGDRCAYCQSFLKFLNDNVNEYGKYFKLVSFEVWHNENNAALMGEVADHFGKSIKGVPFIIIGDKTFQGYTSSYDTEILETITNYYNNKKTYKDEVKDFLVDKEENTTGAAITIIVILAAVAGVGFLIYMAKEDKNIEEKEKINEIALTPEKEEQIPETKKEKKEENKPKNNLEKKTKSPTLPKLKEEKIVDNKKKETTKKSKAAVTSKSKATNPSTLPKKKDEIKIETKTTSKVKAPEKEPTKKQSTTKVKKTTQPELAAKKSDTEEKKSTSKTTTTAKKTASPTKKTTTKKSTEKTNNNNKKNKA